MLFDRLRWVERHPPSHPMLPIELSIATDGYKEVGAMVPPATRRRTADVKALADTGCQACCIGERQMNKLGLVVADLLQPVLNLKAANASGITILGATFVEVVGKAKTGTLISTRQTCYVVKGLDYMLLSKEACQKLGIITDSFPEVGGATVMEVVSPPDGGHPESPSPCTPRPDGTCSCPRRELPPEPPEYNPNMSVLELRNVILSHYASSSFNRCTRQPLPKMRGEPMPIFTDPEATPVAAHTPIKVPTHWTDQVKADLDRRGSWHH